MNRYQYYIDDPQGAYEIKTQLGDENIDQIAVKCAEDYWYNHTEIAENLTVITQLDEHVKYLIDVRNDPTFFAYEVR